MKMRLQRGIAMLRNMLKVMAVAAVSILIWAACTSNTATPPPTPVPDTVVSLRELSAVEVVEILTPSVVQITTESLTMGMFNEVIPRRGVGTGSILDTDGNILTNNHVVQDAQRITVTLSNGDSFPAELVGGDPTTDTAVIRIDAPNLQPAELGSSSRLKVGEDVIGIGHALGLPGGPTVTKGVISALGRSIDTGNQITIVDLIQTDAAINPGNSGGPLVNVHAQIIGMNTAIIQGSQGIGFAINIDDAKIVAEQLLLRGYVERGYLGIRPVNLSPGLANMRGVPESEGVFIISVDEGSAAFGAGLQDGDVIVGLDDDPIKNTGELSKFLIDHPPGQTIFAEILRGEERLTVEITLGERP